MALRFVGDDQSVVDELRKSRNRKSSINLSDVVREAERLVTKRSDLIRNVDDAALKASAAKYFERSK
jgi:hypothetical protein